MLFIVSSISFTSRELAGLPQVNVRLPLRYESPGRVLPRLGDPAAQEPPYEQRGADNPGPLPGR